MMISCLRQVLRVVREVVCGLLDHILGVHCVASMLTVGLLHCSEINDKPPPGMQMPPQPSQPMAPPKKVRATCRETLMRVLTAPPPTWLRACAPVAPRPFAVFAAEHCFEPVPAALGDWGSGSGSDAGCSRCWGCRTRVGTQPGGSWNGSRCGRTRMGRCGFGRCRRGGTEKGARCIALAFRYDRVTARLPSQLRSRVSPD